ncbi:GntR family transcriptional regulator [Aureibacillus halotolerans]|uniref:GntR family transcriptional regulator n=1 Tax=Aureibacillus halotolerans TaxID=1508390 RepID=A0A4R6TZA0_9BACI|nr:GntR family transcriptional regulator [Aureibacillus halotolerans]TDQ36124.1 GntR family transcriptional regulator [Aureibacillus halotolerans]
MVDKTSPIPFYLQLAGHIREEIENEKRLPGDLIPSERELSDAYDISRMTARQAITLLVNEGYVSRKRGKGTFVQGKQFSKTLSGVKSFTEEMQERGLSLRNELISYNKEPASAKIASELKLEKDRNVHRLERLRIVGDDVLAIETTYFPISLFPQWSEAYVESSLYDFIENTCHLRIDHARQEIEAAIAGSDIAAKLNIKKGDPLLVITRITFREDQTPVEWTKTILKGDQYKFIADMKRRG